LHLGRGWGEQLAQDLFNAHEPRYPVLDNFAVPAAGLKYLAAANPDVTPVEPATLVGDLLRLFLTPTWQQFRLDLDGGNVQPPAWDVEAVRAAGPAFLVESLPPDDRFRVPADRALAEGRLSIDPGELDDAGIAGICDYRAALRRARRRLERSLTQMSRIGPAIAECLRRP
jgi:hypothetical protein